MRIVSAIKERFLHFCLSTKLTFTIACTMTVVLAVVIGFTSWRSVDMMNKQQASADTAILNMKLQDLESYYNTLKSYSISIRNDETFMQLVRSKKAAGYGTESYVLSLLRNTYYSRNDIRSYTLYLLNSGVNYSISSASPNIKSGSTLPLSEIPGYNESSRAGDYLYISPTALTDSLFTITRTIIDVADNKPLAAIVIEVDSSYIKNLAANCSNIPGVLCLLDRDNRLFYSSERNIINSETIVALSPYLANPTDAGSFITIDGTNYLAVTDTCESTDWRLVNLLPKPLLDNKVIQLCNQLLLLALGAIIVAVLLILVISKILTKPIYVLANRMNTIDYAGIPSGTEIGGSAEIILLSKRFDEVLSRLRDLVQKNKTAELHEKNACLVALESQVNPSIICSTLEAISEQAVYTGQNKIHTMADTLSSMLDYSIGGRDFVPAASEINYVKDYLFLQKIKYDDKFDYSITVDKKAENLPIPRISIQPLVESVILCGMNEKQDNLFIDINLLLNGGSLLIIIKDNCVHLPSSKFEELKRQITLGNFTPEMSFGTGLINLAARLKLLYNGDALMSLDSIEGAGTTITLCIRIQEAEA